MVLHFDPALAFENFSWTFSFAVAGRGGVFSHVVASVIFFPLGMVAEKIPATDQPTHHDGANKRPKSRDLRDEVQYVPSGRSSRPLSAMIAVVVEKDHRAFACDRWTVGC